MLGEFKDFAFSDLSGVNFDAKTGDVLGNLKVFVLGVGCWALVFAVWRRGLGVCRVLGLVFWALGLCSWVMVFVFWCSRVRFSRIPEMYFVQNQLAIHRHTRSTRQVDGSGVYFRVKR